MGPVLGSPSEVVDVLEGRGLLGLPLSISLWKTRATHTLPQLGSRQGTVIPRCLLSPAFRGLLGHFLFGLPRSLLSSEAKSGVSPPAHGGRQAQTQPWGPGFTACLPTLSSLLSAHLFSMSFCQM